MNLGCMYRTIDQADGEPAQLSPSALAVPSVQSPAIPDSTSYRDRLDAAYLADDLKIHRR